MCTTVVFGRDPWTHGLTDSLDVDPNQPTLTRATDSLERDRESVTVKCGRPSGLVVTHIEKYLFLSN